MTRVERPWRERGRGERKVREEQEGKTRGTRRGEDGGEGKSGNKWKSGEGEETEGGGQIHKDVHETRKGEVNGPLHDASLPDPHSWTCTMQ